jgi:hypothetical protein
MTPTTLSVTLDWKILQLVFLQLSTIAREQISSDQRMTPQLNLPSKSLVAAS